MTALVIGLLVAEAIEVSPEALIGGGSLGGALLYVGMQIGRIASKFGALLEQEKKRREREDTHRELEKKHWEVEEALLRHAAGIPQRQDTGPHTPVHGLPLG